MSSKKQYTLVIGATTKTDRYANIAVNRLLKHNQPVYALGIKTGDINGVEILTGFPKLKDVHTVTLYINAKRQPEYYDYILGLNPARIIFNPGTENEEFASMARARGIEATVACTLVMLSTKQF